MHAGGDGGDAVEFELCEQDSEAALLLRVEDEARRLRRSAQGFGRKRAGGPTLSGGGGYDGGAECGPERGEHPPDPGRGQRPRRAVAVPGGEHAPRGVANRSSNCV